MSYLTGIYGKVGFVITRDNDESLKKGKDLDWVREMHQAHDVIIIKITGTYLTKLLQKLRNPEKHDAINNTMNKLLDLYERSYLNLKSTRRTRSK